MPFLSKAQQKWMFANKPTMAEEWASHMSHEAMKKLPNHVKASAAKTKKKSNKKK